MNAHQTFLTGSLFACALLFTGCGSNQTAASLGNTASAIEQQPFVAPYDPDMGQIVLSIPEVLVSAEEGAQITGLSQTVRSQLMAALAASPNFIVADRQSLPSIADEHRLADAGATEAVDRPLSGRLVGARYLVQADVTELQEQVLGTSSGSRVETGGFLYLLGDLLGIGGSAKQVVDAVAQANVTVGSGNETIEGLVGIEIRVVDVDTGAIVATTRAQGTVRHENSTRLFGIAGMETSDARFQKSVISHATRVAAQQATTDIHQSLKSLVLNSEAPVQLSKSTAASRP